MNIAPEDMMKLLAELSKLNENLASSRQSTLTLISALKDVAGNVKAMHTLSKQIGLLNQIMLSVSKTAGTSGMIQNMVEALIKMSMKAG